MRPLAEFPAATRRAIRFVLLDIDEPQRLIAHDPGGSFAEHRPERPDGDRLRHRERPLDEAQDSGKGYLERRARIVNRARHSRSLLSRLFLRKLSR